MIAAGRLLGPFLPGAAAVAARWISEERRRYRDRAAPLDSIQRELLGGAFEATTLDAVRVMRVTRLENPVFYPDFMQEIVQGKAVLDLRTVGGVTYGDTILISASQHPGVTPIRLLFHELVHVVQYRVLGIDGFAENYVRGWVEAGFKYRRIPLEEQAYSLEAEFAAGWLGAATVERRVQGDAVA